MNLIKNSNLRDSIIDPKFDSDLAKKLRARMVSEQIARRGVNDHRILAALLETPRHIFVPHEAIDIAYEDTPLSIGHGQTISQPYIVGYMTELLNPKPEDVILEVGTGTGYQAAVLSKLVSKIYTIERISALAAMANENFAKLGLDNVEVIVCDGYHGLPENSPFNGIIITSAPPEVPSELLKQLADGANLVIPVGENFQRLWVIKRVGEEFMKSPDVAVRFVPMVHGIDEI